MKRSEGLRRPPGWRKRRRVHLDTAERLTASHPGDVPFGEWADRWLTTKAPKLQPSTVDLYRYLLRRHAVPRFAKAAVGRITAVEVQAWLADLHSTDLSPNTIAKAYRVLSGVMDGAVDARLIARSPLHDQGRGN